MVSGIMGQKIDILEMFKTGSAQLKFDDFLLNLCLAIILSALLGVVFQKFATSLPNRKNSARNFIPLTLITMLVISVVKSSLALSLGLVGALSIVRFRAAIKEPEELVYLFFAIAIGLGCGADQFVVTGAAFAVFAIYVALRHSWQNKTDVSSLSNLFVTVSTNNKQPQDLSKILDAFEKNSSFVELKRLDESSQQVDATFVADLDNYDQIEDLKQELFTINPDLKFSYLESKSVI